MYYLEPEREVNAEDGKRVVLDMINLGVPFASIHFLAHPMLPRAATHRL